MNESETRAELIDPKLVEQGWNKQNLDVKVYREYPVTKGRIKTIGGREQALFADYVLQYKNIKLAVIEAKAVNKGVGEGVAQAKIYASLLNTPIAYSCNGKSIYYINMVTGEEKRVDSFLSPDELYAFATAKRNEWMERFDSIPFELRGEAYPRYYQEIAVQKALEAISAGKKRVLLTLATGTGKTFIAFQIAWKLFKAKWTNNERGRTPRILFLADRNILADQAINGFSAFQDEAKIRITPGEIRKKGEVPKNASLFFTIFQTFTSGDNKQPYYGDYENDFFDVIFVDECHRGGAKDESEWRAILEYFDSAVQIGLTATPKRNVNVNTYTYFGDPVFIYSLKQGIADGFLTPFKVVKLTSTLDNYVFEDGDIVTNGDINYEKIYNSNEFNRQIFIEKRERHRVDQFLSLMNKYDKTLVFCARQEHAADVRDIINQKKIVNDPFYCVRVTADDNKIGEQYLREFQDNEKLVPTILTTSHKLSTGVDALNIRNIVIMRSIKDIVEFKQIIGRGTRLFEGKNYFTIYDFENVSELFKDPDWDGEPDEERCLTCGKSPCTCSCKKCNMKPCVCKCEACGENPCVCVCERCGARPCVCVCEVCGEKPCICEGEGGGKLVVELGPGRVIETSINTMFYDSDGSMISAKDFLLKLYGKLPEIVENEEKLRFMWANPNTRKELITKLSLAGFDIAKLNELRSAINQTNCDIYDVLRFIGYNAVPFSREQRAGEAIGRLSPLLSAEEKEFVGFVLENYKSVGAEELDEDKLEKLLRIKYNSFSDGILKLGGAERAKELFANIQESLYQ